MSFAGHIFDMIRHDTKNREVHKARRARINKIRESVSDKTGSQTQNPKLTLEQLEHAA